MKLFAIYYHKRNYIPTCCNCLNEKSFLQSCQLVSTDWALLVNVAGETVASYPVKSETT